MRFKTSITRRAQFNAAHRLNNNQWRIEKNTDIFGKCNNPNFHGHNYILEVKVIGEVNPDTGYVVDAKILKRIINKEVIDQFDHKNLNLDTSDFRHLIPTAENIARVIYDKIRINLSIDLELKIKLYETENNSVEYPA